MLVQFAYMLVSIQATANKLATLQTALNEAMEENAARKVHEAKLISQFQVGTCSALIMLQSHTSII